MTFTRVEEYKKATVVIVVIVVTLGTVVAVNEEKRQCSNIFLYKKICEIEKKYEYEYEYDGENLLMTKKKLLNICWGGIKLSDGQNSALKTCVRKIIMC